MCNKIEQIFSQTEIAMINQTLRSICRPNCPNYSLNCPSQLWNDKLPACYKSDFKREDLISAAESKASEQGEDALKIKTILKSLEIMTKTDLAAIESPHLLTLKEILEIERHNETAS